jgi:hypothetical protein
VFSGLHGVPGIAGQRERKTERFAIQLAAENSITTNVKNCFMSFGFYLNFEL